MQQMPSYQALLNRIDLPRLITWALPLWGLVVMLALVDYPAMHRDLWADEAFSASYTFHTTIREVLDDVRKNEATPPLYFLLLWGWAQIVGHDEASLRAFSLAAAAIATMLFALLARRHLALPASFLSVTAFALAPILQNYALEVRGYTLTILLGVVSLITFENLWRHPESSRAQANYLASALALFFTSYFSLALLAAQWLCWFWQLRPPATLKRRLTDWAVLHLVMALGIAWWLPSLAYQLAVAPDVTADWSRGPGDYYMLLLSLVVGSPQAGNWFILWLLGAAASIVLILAGASHHDQAIRGVVFRATVLPTLLLFGLCVTLEVTAYRYLSLLLPGAMLAVGAGFSALRTRRALLAWSLLSLVAIALLLPQFIPTTQASQPLKPWQKLSSIVEQNLAPTGDVVIFHPPWDQRIFTYYAGDVEAPLLGAYHYDEFYHIQGYTLRQTWRTEQAVPLIASHRRVWVFYNQMFHTIPPLDLPYREARRWREGKLELILYVVDEP
ncbi:glycosyltransferase family 39 protein [Candidatus Chloroploca sp. Khr17]|uniref:glycosyltransferase family 39 protein n=1 Tax=Candidatus Chloroploca sp. Khr17 TaxID=2496869 RepID=UPI00101D2735|nr:glycosyltransferase family 39 protein [Candidatus Chloroploca sp. Khr17]